MAWCDARDAAKQRLAMTAHGSGPTAMFHQHQQRHHLSNCRKADNEVILDADGGAFGRSRNSSRAKLERIQRMLSCSISRAVKFNMMTNWTAKTRQWKRERRTCAEELNREREAYYLRAAETPESDFAKRMVITTTLAVDGSDIPRDTKVDHERLQQQQQQQQQMGVWLTYAPIPSSPAL